MEEQLAKFFAGEANQEEKEQIMQWRGESAEHAEEFMDAKSAWLAAQPPIESNSAVLESLLADEKPEARIVGWPSYLKYAAALLLIGMISALWYFNTQQDAPLVFNGEGMVLKDGTLVSLKQGSTLEVVEFSDDVRKVKITGKAFFEVTHDESRPFIVLTNNSTVKVLGTSFQVDTNEDFTEVAVETGMVAFATTDRNKNEMSLNLAPGEMGRIGKGVNGILKRRNVNKNLLAWKSGVLNFQRTKAIEMVYTLQDVYGTTISLDPAMLNCRLTAQFNQKSLDEVIKLISSTFDWQYQLDKDKVVLSGKGC